VLIELLIVLAAIILILLATSWSVLFINKRAIPPPYHFVESNGARLHYFEKGSGSPVVFVHGSNGSLQDFKLSVMDLLSKDFRTVAFDRPGHGHSERGHSIEAGRSVHGPILVEAWKKLGIERPVLVGHSSAGAVLMDIAVRRPEEVGAIVLISGVVHSGGMEQVPVMGLYRTISRKYIGTVLLWTLLIPLGGLVGRSLLKFTFAPDPVPKDYKRIGLALALRPKCLRAEGEDLVCIAPTLEAVEGKYGEINVPLVIVYGAKDGNVPPEGQSIQLSKEVPNSVLIAVPETGHMAMFTKPLEVIEAIKQAAQLSMRAR
jgi:pimeloyl-ACP methyl ester carboxylesterase